MRRHETVRKLFWQLAGRQPSQGAGETRGLQTPPTKDAIFNVAELAEALAHDEDIARVEVAVRDAAVVEEFQALGAQ